MFRFQNKTVKATVAVRPVPRYNLTQGSDHHGPAVRDLYRIRVIIMPESSEEAGQKLKRARDRLGLRYRDVEQASNSIAQRHGNDEFSIALSRLSDIENKGTVPTIYRLYSLSAIYRLDFQEVLSWYGVDLTKLPGDATLVELEKTHTIQFSRLTAGAVQFPLSLDPGIDLRRTTHLSRFIQKWGSLPLMLLNGLDLRNQRFAFIGTEDYWMYPVIPPGSLVQIDETRRKPASTGWATEYDRPIYFFEHREGFICSWCSMDSGNLILQPHPSSMQAPLIFAYPAEIDVIGVVTGVAMRLDPAKKRRGRFAADPEASRGR